MRGHPWFVMPVAPRQELHLEKEIRRLGYEAMAPWMEGQKRMRRGGNPRPWKYPLYVGYVFVSLPDHAAGWQHLQGTFNTLERRLVFRLLGGDDPAAIRSADVEYLQSIADGRFRPNDAAPTVVIGDTVIVPEGHLKGQTSIVVKIKRGKTATVKVIGEKNDMTQDFPLAELVKT